jgi:hypothetical protein
MCASKVELALSITWMGGVVEGEEEVHATFTIERISVVANDIPGLTTYSKPVST